MVKPKSNINADLQNRLEDYFKPMGIVAYSKCCRWGCSGSYDEEDKNFNVRPSGIFYIKLYIDGMNYRKEVSSVNINYSSFDYSMSNWEQEKLLIEKFCEIVGKSQKEYIIEKPNSIKECIVVKFSSPLQLE
jgi:hypothetical protein